MTWTKFTTLLPRFRTLNSLSLLLEPGIGPVPANFLSQLASIQNVSLDLDLLDKNPVNMSAKELLNCGNFLKQLPALERLSCPPQILPYFNTHSTLKYIKLHRSMSDRTVLVSPNWPSLEKLDSSLIRPNELKMNFRRLTSIKEIDLCVAAAGSNSEQPFCPVTHVRSLVATLPNVTSLLLNMASLMPKRTHDWDSYVVELIQVLDDPKASDRLKGLIANCQTGIGSSLLMWLAVIAGPHKKDVPLLMATLTGVPSFDVRQIFTDDWLLQVFDDYQPADVTNLKLISRVLLDALVERPDAAREIFSDPTASQTTICLLVGNNYRTSLDKLIELGYVPHRNTARRHRDRAHQIDANRLFSMFCRGLQLDPRVDELGSCLFCANCVSVLHSNSIGTTLEHFLVHYVKPDFGDPSDPDACEFYGMSADVLLAKHMATPLMQKGVVPLPSKQMAVATMAYVVAFGSEPQDNFGLLTRPLSNMWTFFQTWSPATNLTPADRHKYEMEILTELSEVARSVETSDLWNQTQKNRCFAARVWYEQVLVEHYDKPRVWF
jgi:hypothetical protein